MLKLMFRHVLRWIFLIVSMSRTRPFYTAQWAEAFEGLQHPTGQGRGGLQCPEVIASFAAANSLDVIQTVTDGNCGLDSFWKSCGKLTKLRSEPWSTLRQSRQGQLHNALRALAVQWMKDNQTAELWQGFSIQALIQLISGTSVQEWAASMLKNKTWVDTAFLHCLACATGVCWLQEF